MTSLALEQRHLQPRAGSLGMGELEFVRRRAKPIQYTPSSGPQDVLNEVPTRRVEPRPKYGL
jgi:hypothetical protein